MFAKTEDLERSRKFGEAIQRSSFVTRLFVLYIPVWLLMFIFFAIVFSEMPTITGLPLIFGLSLIVPMLKERSIRKWRRKNGFSIYKSIEDDFQRMEVEKILKREQEAKKNLGINDESGALDKSDIRYWHGLLKDGIINEEEYKAKKKELM